MTKFNRKSYGVGKSKYLCNFEFTCSPCSQEKSIAFSNQVIVKKQLGARSPGSNFGVFKSFTPEKNFMRSIQNETPNDMSKFTYVIRSFIFLKK